ncbi:hypothetical protein HIM_04777 [Hirsutella minnesotensis 3608]|uniref:Uncharacterized protein n=1 Tax=Hirsutella minnesotensis 3608 TaxID=1043627 RepID=A0A0F7ZV41_9HYPO|nr:hypothetical protein HIM_04777 [Hirsutella minnesotensis 3608]
MPSRLSNGATTVATPIKFELPALDLNFGRITDGTNIPPPPSPVQKVPTPPQTPPCDKKETLETVHEADTMTEPDTTNETETGNEADEITSTPPNGNAAGSKRSVDEVPLSPAASGRQGSIRRLLSSRNVLNANYTDGRMTSIGSASMANGGRPESRGATSVVDERKSKRSSGWFRRLRGGDSRRSSFYFEDAAPVLAAAAPKQSSESAPKPSASEPPQKPSGPPPPMIPELVDLERDDGILGGDLFKNIK